MTGIFANNNRGKRSLVLDLKQPAGVEVLHRLVAGSDVFIQNFRPGAMERLGLTYEALAAINPRLVYVSISGYGQTGPNSHRRVYDNVIQAASGIAAVQTDSATGVPALLRTLVCDKVTAWTAAQAITAALLARERGLVEGQHLDIAMIDASIAFLWPDSAMDKALLAEDANRSPTIAQSYVVTPMADGYCSGAAVTDAEFRGWCAALGHPEVADDPGSPPWPSASPTRRRWCSSSGATHCRRRSPTSSAWPRSTTCRPRPSTPSTPSPTTPRSSTTRCS